MTPANNVLEAKVSTAKENIHISNHKQDLGEAAAHFWCGQANRAIEQHGAFHVALSGGSTPQLLFKRLVDAPFKNRIDWQKIHIYFGDERCVPMDHSDSNYRMAMETLLKPAGIPAHQIYRIETERDPTAAALHYANKLHQIRPGIASQLDQGLDLLMLGLGPDGHIASLFPDSAILSERQSLAAAVYVEKFSSWRISLTFPVLENAKCILLLAAGEGKMDILTDIFEHPATIPRYPIEMLKPKGHMHWFMDQAAAAGLKLESR